MSEFPKRGDIYWVSLDPVIGSETKKTRPCVIISNNAQNKMSSRVIILPITSNVKKIYPFEVEIEINGTQGKVMSDQIKSIDKIRLGKKISTFSEEIIIQIESSLKIALGLS